MKAPLKSRRRCDQPRELFCRNPECGAEYIGTRGSNYCPKCRPIMTKKHRAEKVQTRKDGTFMARMEVGTIPAICPYCSRTHNVPESYKMTGGRKPRICCDSPECWHKKHNFTDLEEHHVIW